MLLCAEACVKEYFSDLLQADVLVSDTQETVYWREIILFQYIRIIAVIFKKFYFYFKVLSDFKSVFCVQTKPSL